MSFERYPAKRLNRAATDAIKYLESKGLTVESTVRVPHGLVVQHTVSITVEGQDPKVFMSEAYTNDLRCFVAGFQAHDFLSNNG